MSDTAEQMAAIAEKAEDLLRQKKEEQVRQELEKARELIKKEYGSENSSTEEAQR